MSWSDKQKALAVRACKAGGISNEGRELILRQIGSRAVIKGRATSTAAKLTNSDFTRFMANVESYSGGQIKTRDRNNIYLFRFGHWQGREKDNTRIQLIYVAGRIINTIEAHDVPERMGGVIAKATHNRIDDAEDLDELSEAEAKNVVHALRAVAKRHDIQLIGGE